MGKKSMDREREDQHDTLAELANVPLRDGSPYVRQWKEGGGKIVGFTCTYTPEEILYAGDGSGKIMPFRMDAAGCDSTEDADIHMSKMMCGYTKCLLQLGMDGQYDFVDGVVMSSCCDVLRCSYEYWRDEVDPGFLTMLTIPHNNEIAANLPSYEKELIGLSRKIDEHFDRSISDDDLIVAIKTYNTYRKLMRQLYALRALDNPKLSGAEAARIAFAGFGMPKDLFNEKLAALLEELRGRPGISGYRARIMIGGGYMDDTLLTEVIEEAGAIVVTDTLCTGRKHVEGLVDEETDKPFEALSQRYFKRISCPRMIGDLERRAEFAKQLVREARVDGVILQKIAFCNYHAVENLLEAAALEKAGIPTMNLEREYTAADQGRLKTRVQAFLEKIAG